MRIAIETLGTRGDVQPYVALALELIRRGHDVQIAAPVQFASFVNRHGVAFAPLPGEFLALMDSPEAKAAIAGGRGFSAGFKLLKHVRPLMRRLLDEEWNAVRAFRPDVIVYHPKSVATPHMAEALGCPAILASPLPGFTPTAAFASPMLPFASLGPLNRASHVLSMRAADFLFGKQIGDWRTSSLGLAGRRANARVQRGTLYAYSKHVVPVPADWNQDVMVTGYWFLDDESWQPSERLAAFLGAGEPPVYVGFGSMPGLDPRRMTALVVEALAKAGRRGLLVVGGGALDGTYLPANVHAIDGAPHDRLLPYVAVAMHHGGAGTTAACLRAGKAMIVCPFFGDQPFWARQVARLGVAPPALDRKSLSVDRLAAAFAVTDDPRMRHSAATLGAAIRQEKGVATAAEFVERQPLARGWAFR